MKRILLILSMIVLLASCTRNSHDEYIDGNPDKQANIMKRISSNTDGCFYTEVWVDTETGCEYFFCQMFHYWCSDDSADRRRRETKN